VTYRGFYCLMSRATAMASDTKNRDDEAGSHLQ